MDNNLWRPALAAALIVGAVFALARVQTNSFERFAASMIQTEGRP